MNSSPNNSGDLTLESKCKSIIYVDKWDWELRMLHMKP